MFLSADMIPTIMDAILNQTPSDDAVYRVTLPGLDLTAHVNIAVGNQAWAGEVGNSSSYRWVAKRYNVKKDRVQGQKRNRPAQGRRSSTAVSV
jgi:hypothetical protein